MTDNKQYMELIIFLSCVGVIALVGLIWTLIDMRHEAHETNA